MKLKTTLFAISALVLGGASADAASMIVSNIANGPGDRLYANAANVPLATGFVTIGYFVEGITLAQINTVAGLQAVLATPSNYITVASAVPGLTTSGVGNGYAEGQSGSAGTILAGDPLLGRTIYSIVTNQASLAGFASGSGTGNQVGLVNVGTIGLDLPLPQSYSANPVPPATIVIGTIGTFNGDAGLGSGTYSTLQLSAIPEPSAALLGALGALGLLRRRRI